MSKGRRVVKGLYLLLLLLIFPHPKARERRKEEEMINDVDTPLVAVADGGGGGEIEKAPERFPPHLAIGSAEDRGGSFSTSLKVSQSLVV